MRVKFYMRRVDDKIERVPFHVFSTHRFGYDDGFAWQAALEIVRKEHPNLVLLDIAMPKMDGIETARRMQAEKLLDATKVMFLTNSTDIMQIATAVEVGSSDYLIKADWDIKDILKRVLEKLEKS